MRSHRTVLSALVAVLAASACHGGDVSEISAPPRGSAKATSSVSVGDVEVFRAALGDTPLSIAAFALPTSFASLEGRSTARVDAEIVDVRQGPTLIGRSSEVACEESEGKPTGEVCEVRDDMETIVFTLQVNRARNLRGVVNTDTPVYVKMTVGPGWETPERARTLEAIKRIIDATPLGLDVIAYLTPSSVDSKYYVLSHPDAWAALVGGHLLSLATTGDERPGLVGVTNPEQLPN